MKKCIWHPLCRPDEEKIKIASGNGIYITDVRGKTYMDANSGLWNVSLGYSNKSINSKVSSQIQKISYVNACEFNTEVAEELATLLKSIHHKKIETIVFTCTGSESVELTMKLMRKYASMGKNPYKRDIAIIKNSYHGSYYGSMSCSSYDGEERMGYVPLVEGIHELSLPFCTCCKSDNVSESCTKKMKEQLESELEAFGDCLGGIILEPILGSAGVIPLPYWFIKRLVDYANEKDILIAFDEVATGFGRTGTLFYYQRLGFEPDIITMSKGINNGMLPLGAVAVSDKIVNRFRDKGEILFHLSTQNGNALSCAAGIATVNELLKDDRSILNRIEALSAYFQNHFETLIGNDFNQIIELRRCGLMFAVELGCKDTGKRLPQKELLKIVALLKKSGVILEWRYIENVTSCLVLFLPFIIHECEIDQLLHKLKNVFKRILK